MTGVQTCALPILVEDEGQERRSAVEVDCARSEDCPLVNRACLPRWNEQRLPDSSRFDGGSSADQGPPESLPGGIPSYRRA